MFTGGSKASAAVAVAALFGFSFTTAMAGPLCALAPAGHDTRYDYRPNPTAEQQMQSVRQYLCSRYSCPNFRYFQNPTISNAMASTDQNGYTIRYSSNFMTQVYNRYGPLSTVGILAHELGHIIDYNNNPGNVDYKQREVTADKIAGCAFALAGHPERDLSALASTLHAMGASPLYPTPSERVQLLRIGYRNCSSR